MKKPSIIEFSVKNKLVYYIFFSFFKSYLFEI